MTEIALTRPARYARKPVRVFALFYDGTEHSVLSIAAWLGDDRFVNYDQASGELTVVTVIRDDGTKVTQTLHPHTYLVRFYATRDHVVMSKSGFEQLFTEER